MCGEPLQRIYHISKHLKKKMTGPILTAKSSFAQVGACSLSNNEGGADPVDILPPHME
jgi:hypothetical protein